MLAFVVLLTGLVVAFFSRAVSERTESSSNVNDTEADILAHSAAEMVIADLKQEVIANSNATTVGARTIYLPTNATAMLPARSGNPPASGGVDPIPNLVRRSWNADTNLSATGVRSRASAINSETDISRNKRLISRAAWNSHYLIPRDPALYGGLTKSQNIGTDPVPDFKSPDWVMITSTGPKVLMVPDLTTIGRYAYAIYDEGGLLDINAAGYPYHSTGTDGSGNTTYGDGISPTDIGRKGGVPLADLTQINLSKGAINDIIGWRNYATVQPKSTFTQYDFDNPTSAVPNTATRYMSYVLGNTRGFLSPSFVTKAAVPPAVFDRTDQMFTGRQTLLTIRRAIIFSQDALQYLTTFSREMDVPTWSPAVTSAVNPDFRQTLAVKRRFPLSRLVWLTYKGPSAGDSAASPPLPPRGSSDADIATLTGTYGMSPAYLAEGTGPNIQKAFGLVWNSPQERWDYAGPSGSTPLNSIATLASVAGREPNFFELLQAGIADNSLGGSNLSTFATTHQSSKMLHVLTIGANLISEVTVDSYPTRIACMVGTATMEAVGTERLPYVNAIGACAVGSSSSGGVSWFLVPNIWNPFRNTASLVTAPLRPTVQLTVSGSASFAGVSGTTTTAVSTTVSTGTVGMSVLLLSGNAAGGRDFSASGISDARKLGAADLPAASVSPTPATFNAYPFASESSNGTATATAGSIGWRLTNDIGGGRYAVVRMSHPKTPISTTVPSVFGSNPALILNSGFQVSLDYQSPSGVWRSYSFLQGNNDTGTWMGQVKLTDNSSVYATVTGTSPGAGTQTITASADTSQIRPWAMTTLNVAPTFIKSDPRSIRFNSVIGTLSTASTAAVVNSIWPSGTAPQDLGSGAKNPALYAQNISGGPLNYRDGGSTGPVRMGDNGPAATNPYATGQDANRPINLNRPFRSVAEMGYAFRDQPFKSLDFLTADGADAGLLDLFSVSENTNAVPVRAGVVSVNTRQAPVLAALISGVVKNDDIVPNFVSSATGSAVAQKILDAGVYAATPKPFVNKADIIAALSGDTTIPLIKTQHEATLRSLADCGQTRTWNLMIDIIAQSGRYAPAATQLKDFVVQGEKRYWLHVAIDRFTGEVIDQQLEAVYE